MPNIDMGGNILYVQDVRTGITSANRAASSGAPLAATTAVGTATLALTRNDHLGRTILLNGAPSVAVLPAATGTGDIYRFIVTVTGNHVIRVANASDTFVGALSVVLDGAAAAGGVAGTTDDTLTFNSTTAGGIAGTWIEAEDIASTKWYLRGIIAGSGTLTAPTFSAGV